MLDSRPTVAWPPTTVAWPFSSFYKKFPNCLKRRKTLFDSRLTVAWPPTTVAWPFSDFFQNFPKSLETSKKRCLTVSRRSRDLRPLSRDRSATFFKIFPNRLKRPKNVVWQSADGRVTSDHCRVTVQRLFSNFFLIAWNVEKTLFDSQPTVAWPPTTVAWPFSDFFQNFRKSLETSRKRCLTVGRRSRDLRLLSRDRSATFFKNFPNCLKRPKNVVWQSADGRVTSSTVAWPFSDFFQNFPKSLETSKKRCLTVGRRSRDPNHCRVTVQRLFSKFSQMLETSKKRCLTVSRRSRDLRPLSRDRSATFFKFFSNCLKRPKNVVWQSADGRVTSDHCRVTVQRLFSNFFLIAWNVQKTLFDSRPTVAWPQPLSRDRSATFFKIFPNRLKRPKTLFDSRPTVAWPPTTVAWPFSDFFQIFF